MRVRQVQRLAQLPAQERRRVAAEGLELIAQNVSELLKEAEAIVKSAPRGARIIQGIAEEEAGKAFLLVDYLRPYRSVDEHQRSKHLARFYDHLSRSIYARYYDTRPADFGEVIRIIEDARKSRYLDGPNGLEWIFRNDLRQRREELLYVDYVEQESELQWTSPAQSPTGIVLQTPLAGELTPSQICWLLGIMDGAGLLSAEALTILAELWRDEDLGPQTHWQRCVRLNEIWVKTCAEGEIIVPSENISAVYRNFLFPLCGLDLSEEEVKWADLDAVRERSLPNYM